MGIFSRVKKDKNTDSTSVVQTGNSVTHPFWQLSSYSPLSSVNDRVYSAMREGVPIVDSAINKIVRLVGGFKFETGNEKLDYQMNTFFSNINVGGNRCGIQCFIDTYLDQLLTYGTSIGEIVADQNGIYGLYNGDLRSIDVKRKKESMELEFFNNSVGQNTPIKYPNLILFSVLNPEPNEIRGTSLLKGLPFVTDILLKIYNTIGTNWERVGNLRYAVTYKPQNDSSDKAFAKQRANQMANAWKDAMSSKDSVKDFVAVGDVNVKVIGADNQVLDSEIPVRQMLEQIIAKTGLMPYMFGLNWSTTERMSQQQADILTSELKAYRRILTPVIEKIGDTYLKLNGIARDLDVVWDDITLQDQTQLAEARLYDARAKKIIQEVEA